MPRKTYTREEKENALRLCDEIGVHKASKETGISANSLYKWRTGAEDEIAAVAVEADKIPVEEVAVEEKDAAPIKGKRYSAEEKERALQLYDNLGLTKTSKQTGITINSLRKWRADAQSKIVISAATGEIPADEIATG